MHGKGPVDLTLSCKDTSQNAGRSRNNRFNIESMGEPGQRGCTIERLVKVDIFAKESRLVKIAEWREDVVTMKFTAEYVTSWSVPSVTRELKSAEAGQTCRKSCVMFQLSDCRRSEQRTVDQNHDETMNGSISQIVGMD
jgi:hypothetical protein